MASGRVSLLLFLEKDGSEILERSASPDVAMRRALSTTWRVNRLASPGAWWRFSSLGHGKAALPRIRLCLPGLSALPLKDSAFGDLSALLVYEFGKV